MTTIETAIPKWILIVSGLFALMEIMVSFSICFAPESFGETVDLKAKGVDFLLYMWGSRQFALGVVFGFATFKRSAPMLTLAYVFFLVMFLGDLVIGLSLRENSMVIAAIVMVGISSAMLYMINKSRIGTIR